MAKVRQTRSKKFTLVLAQKERDVLEALARRRGYSAATVIRVLIDNEAIKCGIKVPSN